MTPKRETRPYVGLSPTVLVSAAGWRIEPPVSVLRALQASARNFLRGYFPRGKLFRQLEHREVGQLGGAHSRMLGTAKLVPTLAGALARALAGSRQGCTTSSRNGASAAVAWEVGSMFSVFKDFSCSIASRIAES